MAATLTMRGTIKRTSSGALVAEVWSGERAQIGDTVTVGETTARVIDRGRNFKRNGYGFCYLYLAEEHVSQDAVAPATVVPEWQARLEREYAAAMEENAEDAGEYDNVSLPPIPSPEDRAARKARQARRDAVIARVQRAWDAASFTFTPGVTDSSLRVARTRDSKGDRTWFEVTPDHVTYVVYDNGRYASWTVPATDDLVAAVEALA